MGTCACVRCRELEGSQTEMAFSLCQTGCKASVLRDLLSLNTINLYYHSIAEVGRLVVLFGFFGFFFNDQL